MIGMREQPQTQISVICNQFYVLLFRGMVRCGRHDEAKGRTDGEAGDLRDG